MRSPFVVKLHQPCPGPIPFHPFQQVFDNFPCGPPLFWAGARGRPAEEMFPRRGTYKPAIDQFCDRYEVNHFSMHKTDHPIGEEMKSPCASQRTRPPCEAGDG